jgi:hypothetical protein
MEWDIAAVQANIIVAKFCVENEINHFPDAGGALFSDLPGFGIGYFTPWEFGKWNPHTTRRVGPWQRKIIEEFR